MNSENLYEHFCSMTFNLSCFKNIGEIETKLIIGLDGLDVQDDAIIIKSKNENGMYDYVLVQRYSFMRSITYKNVIEFLEDTIKDKHSKDMLKDIVECPGRTNPRSLRTFELVWEIAI